jgi:hypothetical protein
MIDQGLKKLVVKRSALSPDFREVEKTATIRAKFGVYPGMPGKLL